MASEGRLVGESLLGLSTGGPTRPPNTHSLGRYLLILFIVAIGAIYAAPNLFQPDPALQIKGTDAGQTVSAAQLEAAQGVLEQANIDIKSAVVLEDGSLTNATPAQWSGHVAKLYDKYQANYVVAEINQGGDMVKSVLQASDQNLPIQMVRATRGKWLRAEPVAALYEAEKVQHFGQFEELEDQMCNFTSHGLMGEAQRGQSPDRLDALVWALTSLCLGHENSPNIRSL